MSIIYQTQISIYGKHGPSIDLFKKVLNNINIGQRGTVYIILDTTEEDKLEHLKRYGNEHFYPMQLIRTPSYEEITDIVEKSWSGFREIQLYLSTGMLMQMYMREIDILEKSFEKGIASMGYYARSRKADDSDFRFSKKILSISSHLSPQEMPKKSMESLQDLIKSLEPSKEYCADISVEEYFAHDKFDPVLDFMPDPILLKVRESEIITIKELSQALDSYKTNIVQELKNSLLDALLKSKCNEAKTMI